MRIINILFAYVALLNFAKIGARREDGISGHGRDSTERQNHQGEEDAMNNGNGVGRGRGGHGGVREPRIQFLIMPEHPMERRQTVFPIPNPDLVTWMNHGHNHATEIQNHVPDRPNRAQKRIVLAKVVNTSLAERHELNGELLPNSNITTCNGPFGYAIVDMDGSERLYACLKPSSSHSEHENRVHSDVLPEFVVFVIREGMVPRRLEGVLTTGDAAITHYGYSEGFVTPHSHPLAHVRYIKTDRINPNNSINADGYVYEP